MLGRLYELGAVLEKRGVRVGVKGVYVLTIDEDGEIMSIVDKGDFETPIPFYKPNRTSGVVSGIIVDNGKYVFGLEKKLTPLVRKYRKEKGAQVALENAYEAYRRVNKEYIKDYIGKIEGAEAYAKFLDKEHDIKKHLAESGIKELDGNIVFTVVGSKGYLHEEKGFKRQEINDKTAEGMCGVTGVYGQVIDVKMNSIDRILLGRDKIDPERKRYLAPSNIGGGNTTKLLSNNVYSIESYGLKEGFNARMSRDAIDKIDVAMDYLTKTEGHSYVIDGLVISIWKKSSEAHPEFEGVFGKKSVEEEETKVKAKNEEAYRKLSRGYAEKPTYDSEEEYYIMGYSFLDGGFVPEFFYECQGEDTAKVLNNIRQHTDRLKVHGGFVSLGGMLWASKDTDLDVRKKEKKTTKSIKHLVDSILWNRPIPQEYYIKYVTNLGKKLMGYNAIDNKDILTTLVKVGTEQRKREGEDMKNTSAYQLGLMLAMGEKLQYSYIREKENRVVKRSIKAELYGFCEGMPQNGMQRVDEKVRVYLKDLGGSWMGAGYKEAVREIGELGGLPKKFTLEEKAAMMIGYYDGEAKRNPSKTEDTEKTEGEIGGEK